MTKTFTFTDRDLQILTNFSEISQHIEFRKGRRQATIETNRSLLAEYDFDTEIKDEFCIYDLPEFLNLIDLFKNPKITLNENKLLLKENKLKIGYSTADTNIILKPNYTLIDKNRKKFNEKDNDIEFDLTADDIKIIEETLADAKRMRDAHDKSVKDSTKDQSEDNTQVKDTFKALGI